MICSNKVSTSRESRRVLWETCRQVNSKRSTINLTIFSSGLTREGIKLNLFDQTDGACQYFQIKVGILVDREHGVVNVCKLTGVCESKIEVIQQMRAGKDYGKLRPLLPMEKSEREERNSTEKWSSRLRHSTRKFSLVGKETCHASWLEMRPNKCIRLIIPSSFSWFVSQR